MIAHPYVFVGLDSDTRRDIVKLSKSSVTEDGERFANYCFEFFEITAADIKSRNAKVTAARAMIDLYYMSTGFNIKHIADYIQRCHHTTIISRLRSLNSRLKEPEIHYFFAKNPQLKKTLNEYIYGK